MGFFAMFDLPPEDAARKLSEAASEHLNVARDQMKAGYHLTTGAPACDAFCEALDQRFEQLRLDYLHALGQRAGWKLETHKPAAPDDFKLSDVGISG